VSTPAGLEPAASGLRARRQDRLRPRGVQTPAAGLEPCDLAINSRASYPLDHAGTDEADAAGIEAANGRGGRLPGSSPRSYEPCHASAKRKERESNPQGLRAHPFSRRDTAPVAVLPRGGPGRRRTCTVPGKNRELCRLELRSLDDVAGRDRTCDAPRFRRALYRAELRPREIGGAGVEPAASSDQSGAPPPGLSSGRRGLGSN
jgi:hypothetical protein